MTGAAIFIELSLIQIITHPTKFSMNTKRPSSAGMLLLSILLLISAIAPIHKSIAQEKSVAELITDLSSGDDRTRRDAAMFLSNLAAESSDVIEAVPALVKALDDSEQQVWFHSVTALSRLGPDAAPAIPKLIDDLGRMSRRGVNVKWYRSAHALGQIGEAAVEPLLKACQNSNSSTRAGAAKAFEWIPEAVVSSVPALIHLLEDADEDVRDTAAETLGVLPEPALTSLKANMTHANAQTRAAVYQALGVMGLKASSLADPLLNQLASETDTIALQKGLEALAKMDVPITPFAEQVKTLFSREEEVIQQAVANAILSMPSEVSVPMLIERLDHPELDISIRAAELLGHLGSNAIPALKPLLDKAQGQLTNQAPNRTYQKAFTEIGLSGVPILLEHIGKTTNRGDSDWITPMLADYGMIGVNSLKQGLETDNPRQIEVILNAFALMETQAMAAASEIAGLTHHKEPSVRSVAVEALASIGLKSAKFSEIIEPLLTDESLEVRQAAVSSLRKVPEAAEGQLGKLKGLLDDPSAKLRASALLALSSVGQRAADLAHQAATLLADPDVDVKKAAIRALGSFRSAPTLAISQMDWLGYHGDPDIRLLVLESLSKLSDQATSSLPLFEASLDHENNAIRLAALEGFSMIETQPEKQLPILVRALDDTDQEIRHASLKAMTSLDDAAAGAIPALIRRLEESEDREMALGVLRRLPSETDYLDNYVSALEHDDPGVRAFGCRALGKLGKEAESALPALRQARRDRYRFVREQADEAIKRIEG